MDLYERIRAIRELLGFSWYEVAEELCIEPEDIEAFESGKTIPTDTQIIVMASLFRVPKEFLADGSLQGASPDVWNEMNMEEKLRSAQTIFKLTHSWDDSPSGIEKE